ncbi:hypothetical protein ALP66_05719 [Pseudomonas amygdali pv. photiniae]|uniref:Uncharacterized protein n=1 Tax=Pseudomonas amygdali pv. photiniae TaxID=251724 RepID=A0A658KDI4_PSEA0|nr:hypothetical protein ALP66_05719 [Pseudomonas amygdali pv. photiniae]
MLQSLGGVEVFLEVVADDGAQVAFDLVVDHVLGQLPAPQVRQQFGFGKLQAGWHVDVSTGPCALERIVNGVEITDDHALIAPFALEHFSDQVMVFTGIVAVDLVETAHDRGDIGVLHHRLEARQVQFTQGALIDLDVDCLTIGFLLVGQVVLAAGLDALGLNAVDNCRCQYRAEERVLTADIFCRTTVVGRAVQVDAWRQHLLAAGNPCLISDGQAEFLGPVDAPGRCQRRLRRVLSTERGIVDVYAHGRVIRHGALDAPLEQGRDHVAVVDASEVDLFRLVHVVENRADARFDCVTGRRGHGGERKVGLHDAERQQAQAQRLFEG